MRKKKCKFKYKSTKDDKKTKEISFLEKHNAYSYLEDLNIMGKLFNISKSKRDWIETTRYQLQNSANIYEKTFAEYLHNKKIEFIHQAPYVIDNKIYFLDFYLKDYNIAVELDGQYHDSQYQHDKDKYRDELFKSISIKTIRINNSEVKDKNRLKIVLTLNGIIVK